MNQGASDQPTRPLAALLSWVAWVVAHPRLALALVLVVTAVAGWVAVDRYAMNSRLGDLVQQDANWRTDYEAFQEAFPQLVETAVVVVSGTSLQRVEQTALELEARISADQTRFVDVYAPGNDPFFRNNAFLLLKLDDLDALSNELAEAQPMLTAVAEDASLRGVLQLISSAVAQLGAADSDTTPAGFASLLATLAESAAAARDGENAEVAWRDEFFNTGEQTHYRLIFLRGVQNYGATLPQAEIVAGLQQIIAEVSSTQGRAGDEVRVALTGEVALRHDEIQAATGGVKIAGVVALILLGLVLALGVRSTRVVLATFAVLLVGVVWTSAWAMLSVGSYNTLSLVFLVMFFGLGVDFCVHFCLRVQEAAGSVHPGEGEQDDPQAKTQAVMRAATRSVGGALVLCTVTTAIGFLGFVPTPYKGLADLGVISAGGMVVACVLAFTLLPALFALIGLPRGTTAGSRGSSFFGRLVDRRVPVLSILAVLIAGSLWLVPRMQFDYSVLALRDPAAQSMVTLRELQREKQITDYALYSLVEREQLPGQQALAELATVDQVTTPLDYVPAEQEEKVYVLEDLQELLGSALEPQSSVLPPDTAELWSAVETAAQTVRDKSGGVLDSELQAALAALLEQLDALLVLRDTAAPARADPVLLSWQTGVVEPLAAELDWLRTAVAAQEFSFADLPAAMRARLVTPDGRYLSAILPAEDIAEVAALSSFITSVRAQVPTATGRPVVEWGVGNIVLESFRTALLVALGGIGLVLLVVLRSVRDTLLVLTPLVLTALFTVATSVLLGVPVNMASVLVLPLIFGLGVDNGIHMVERYHAEASDVAGFMQSSTPRAVVLSTLTTIGTFAALMLSPHAGTASIGFLLTVAVGYLLVFTVFLLPLLLSLVRRP